MINHWKTLIFLSFFSSFHTKSYNGKMYFLRFSSFFHHKNIGNHYISMLFPMVFHGSFSASSLSDQLYKWSFALQPWKMLHRGPQTPWSTWFLEDLHKLRKSMVFLLFMMKKLWKSQKYNSFQCRSFVIKIAGKSWGNIMVHPMLLWWKILETLEI